MKKTLLDRERKKDIQALMAAFFSLIVFLLFPLDILSATSTFKLSFQPNDFAFQKKDGFDQVKLTDGRHLGEPGAPQLPVKFVQIAIPPNLEVADIEVNYETHRELKGTYSIYPAQKLYPLLYSPGNTIIPEFTQPDAKLYNSDVPYPGKLAEVFSNGFLAGQPIAGIAIYPLQYIPSSKKLILYNEIEFSLVFKPSDNQPTPINKKSPNGIKLFSNLAKSLVINPQDVNSDKPLLSNTDLTEYLIITSSDLIPAFQTLANWKTQKGVPAGIVDVSWIYSHYPGVDNAEKTRNCIKDYYQNHGTIWVLLGGDINYVPYRNAFAFVSGEGYYPWEDTIPCDWYFSDLDGSWNDDGDNTWGEYSDGVDLYPDVFVGRASVDNLAKAQTFVNKTLLYEKYPDLTYLDSMLLAAEILWAGCDGGELLDYLYDTFVSPDSLFPNPTKLYESLGNLNYTNFRDALQAGKNFSNHCGHGNIDLISIGSSYFANSNADGLTNGGKLGLFYTFACISNAFDFDCLGEHFVNNPNGGTFCYIGNTRYGWGDWFSPLEGPGPEFNREFYRVLFDSNYCHLGLTLADSKLPFIPSASTQDEDGPYYRWTIYTLNLLGDPETPFLTMPESPPTSFAPPLNYFTCRKPTSIFAADLNKDGYKELAVAGLYYGFSVLINDGSGGFLGGGYYTNNGNLYSISGADFNMDGDMDLVTADSGESRVSFYENDGYGGFSDYLHFDLDTIISEAAFPTSVTVAYLNNDLYADLAVTHGMYVSIFYNDKQGGFEYLGVGSSDVPRYIIAADLDGDGLKDLVTANTVNNSITIFRNHGGDGFYPYDYTVGNGPVSVFASDLIDGDGDLDLVVANEGANYVSIMRNVRGEDYMYFEIAGQCTTLGYHPTSVYAADLDGDTDKDIIVSARSEYEDTGAVFIFLNDGDNTFIPMIIGTEVGRNPRCVVATDLDGDGDNEIAVASSVPWGGGGGLVYVFENLTDIPVYPDDPDYVPGDVNGNGVVNAADIVYLQNYLYIHGTTPPIMQAADANGDCTINAADIVYLINYLYIHGTVPVAGCVE